MRRERFRFRQRRKENLPHMTLKGQGFIFAQITFLLCITRINQTKNVKLND